MLPWVSVSITEQLLAALLADAGQEPDGVGLADAALEVDDRDGRGAAIGGWLHRPHSS